MMRRPGLYLSMRYRGARCGKCLTVLNGAQLIPAKSPHVIECRSLLEPQSAVNFETTAIDVVVLENELCRFCDFVRVAHAL